MTRPLLALCMIVKDEAHAIARTIQSARVAIDHFTVLDTGSTDTTPDTTQRLQRGLDHFAVDVLNPFQYDWARNRVLDAESGREHPATWCLSLSADEVLVNGANLRDFLTAYDGPEDALLVEVRTPMGAFDYPRILRTGGKYHYVGAIHEEPRHQDDPSRPPTVKIPGCRIEYAPTDHARLAARLRERDLPLLRQQLDAAKPKTEARARALVLLAQTQEQIAAFSNDSVTKTLEALAALGWYIVAGVEEGVFFAQWKALNLAETLGIYKPREMLERVRDLAQKDPSDPAVAYMLAAACYGAGEWKDSLRAARHAAAVALASVVDPKNPHDPHGLLWRPHLIAALCSKRLGHRREDVRQSIEAGLAAGGPPEVFADLRI